MSAAMSASKDMDDSSFEKDVRTKCASNLDLFTASSVNESVSTLKASSVGTMVKMVTDKPEQLELNVSSKVVGTLKNLVTLAAQDADTETIKSVVTNSMGIN